MTPVDHRRPPARVARRQHKGAARHDDAEPRRPRKVQRSHSAVGAAIVAAAALVAVFAFILTRGSSSPPNDDGLRLGSAPEGGAAAPAAPVATDDASTKADRNAPARTSTAPKVAPKTTAPVNTGPTSPTFKRGQWIVVLDKYPTDAGMEADQIAKGVAAKLIKAGVPAKAMLVNGQYPGLANSSMEPVTDTWMVYLGPGASPEQMIDLCSAPKTQRIHSNMACPTYEPAAAPGG
ncbi:MAG TPA: hypothetical protein VFI00_07460 [Kribbella sp.]|nr:hypothetical protein [Kribbella sp.]